MDRLATGDASVSALSEPFAVSAPAISQHLRVLEGAGLITRRKEGRERVCRLNRRPLVELQDWLEKHRRFWENRFDALAEFLDEEEQS